MERFKFKFQGVLNYKQIVEDMKSVEFINANNELKKEEKILQVAINQKKDLNEQKNQSMKSTTIKNLRYLNNFIDHTNKKIKEQNERIKVAEDKANEKKRELVDASKEKKMIEKLKSKEYEDFIMIQKKNEEKFVDQINSFNSCKL